MKKRVVLIREFLVEIPDNMIPDLLEGYKGVIDSNADVGDLFCQVAFFDGDRFIEGIGNPDDYGIKCEEEDRDIYTEEADTNDA